MKSAYSEQLTTQKTVSYYKGCTTQA